MSFTIAYLTPRYTIGRFPKEEGPVRDTRITRSIESGSDLLKSGANHMPVGVLDVPHQPVMGLDSRCFLPAPLWHAIAACGDKGGPSHRAPSGRCVGWADIGDLAVIHPLPDARRKTRQGGAATAYLGQKAWDAGKDARKAAGRSD
jgi:hypothetical protein